MWHLGYISKMIYFSSSKVKNKQIKTKTKQAKFFKLVFICVRF